MLGSTKEVVRRISPWVPELLKSGASTAQLQNLVKLDPLPKVGQSKKKINIHQSELPKTSVPQIRVPKNAHGKIWTCISKLMTWVVQVSRSKIICGKYSICCIPDSLSMTIPPKAAKATAIASGAVCHVVVKDHYVIM